MKKLLFILLFPGLLRSQKLDDETLHVYAGVTIGIGVSQLLYPAFQKPFRTPPISFGVVCLAGWGKEEHDNRTGGTGFNNSDLAHTMWGGALATIINCPIIDIRIKRENKALLKLNYQYITDQINLSTND